MRFVILFRTIFFLFLGFELSLFVFDSNFCISFKPAGLKYLQSECEEQLNSIISVNSQHKTEIKREKNKLVLPANDQETIESYSSLLKNAKKLGEIPKKLKETTEKVKENARKVEATTEKVEKTTQKANETTENVKETTEKANKTTENVKETTEKANKTTENVKETTESIKETTEKANKTTENVKETSGTTETTTEKLNISSTKQAENNKTELKKLIRSKEINEEILSKTPSNSTPPNKTEDVITSKSESVTTSTSKSVTSTTSNFERTSHSDDLTINISNFETSTVSEFNEVSDEKTIGKIAKNSKDEWYEMSYSGNRIRLAIRTCYEYDFKLILTPDDSDISQILSPLRLVLILVISSALIGILDISLKMFIDKGAFVQTILHDILQVFFWSSILTLMEKYRRSWDSLWSNQLISLSIPIFPRKWFLFEIIAILMILISIIDFILFKFSTYRIKLVNSQGIYKCIEVEMENVDKNGTFRSIPDDED